MSTANGYWGVWTQKSPPVVSRIHDEYYLHETSALKVSENPTSDAFSRATDTHSAMQAELRFPVLQDPFCNPTEVRKRNKQMMKTQKALKSEWRNLLFLSSVKEVETIVFGVGSPWMSFGRTRMQHWPKKRRVHGSAYQSHEKQFLTDCTCSDYCQGY